MENNKKVIVDTIQKAVENIPDEVKKVDRSELIASCSDYILAKESITEKNKELKTAQTLKKTAESFLLNNLGDLTLYFDGYNFLVKPAETTKKLVDRVNDEDLIKHVKKERPELMKGFTERMLDKEKLVEYVITKHPEAVEKFQNEVLTDSFGLVEKLKETEPELVSQFTNPEIIEKTTQPKLTVVKGKK